jgi:hypothetical protein
MTCKLHKQDDCIPCTFLPSAGDSVTVPGKKSAKAKKPKAGEPDAEGNIAGSFKGRLRVCEVASDSDPKRSYAICVKDGIWECACPAWTRSRKAMFSEARETATGGTVKRVNCKHIHRVLQWFKGVDKSAEMYGNFALKTTLAIALNIGIKPTQQWIDFVKTANQERQDAVLVLLPLLAGDDTLTVAGAWNSIWTVLTMEQG